MKMQKCRFCIAICMVLGRKGNDIAVQNDAYCRANPMLLDDEMPIFAFRRATFFIKIPILRVLKTLDW